MRPFHDQSTATLPTSWLSRLRMGAVLVVLASAGAGGAVAQEGIDPPSAVLSPPTSYRSLSLRQAIELALINNRTLEKAGLDRGVQRFDLKVAEDEFVPNLDLVTSVQHNPITIAGSRTETDTGIITPVVSQRIPTGARFGVAWDNLATDNSAQPDTVYGSNVFLEFEQPLLRGAGFRANLAGLRIARLSEKSNLQEFRRLVINTITNVVFAYRSLQQAQRQVEVSESAVARAREQLRINRALVSSGIIPPVEIIQTEADIANQEFDLLTAQSVRDSSRLALVRLLDVERDSYFVAVEQITLPEFIPNLERCRRLAFENRPDYRQILTGKAISDLAVDVAKNNQLWSLNLNSRYRIAGDDIRYSEAVDRSFSRYNEDWAVGLTLRIPFGDLTRKQTFLRARNQARKARIDITEVTENIEIEVRDALRTIELASRRVQVAGVARELTERKLEIEKGKLQTGRTTNFAIVTFQNDLVSARRNEIDAQTFYLNSLTALDQTLGTTLDAWNVFIDDYGDYESPAQATFMANTP